MKSTIEIFLPLYIRILLTVFLLGPGLAAAGTVCTTPARNNGLIYGKVVGVQGQSAIVQFDDHSLKCKDVFYLCGDFRRPATGHKEFFGIIRQMTDLGNGKFSIFNDCPLNWPPKIGERVFIIYKTCQNNYCPPPKDGDDGYSHQDNPCLSDN